MYSCWTAFRNSVKYKKLNQHKVSTLSTHNLIPYSSIISIHSSLCFWCGPAVPSALPAPRWYRCRSAPSHWRCADFARYSGWHCSETLCPGAARFSVTAGASAEVGKNDTNNQGELWQRSMKKTFRRENKICSHSLRCQLVCWWTHSRGYFA